MKKKISSLLLCMVLCFSLIGNAFAANNDTSVELNATVDSKTIRVTGTGISADDVEQIVVLVAVDTDKWTNVSQDVLLKGISSAGDGFSYSRDLPRPVLEGNRLRVDVYLKGETDPVQDYWPDTQTEKKVTEITLSKTSFELKKDGSDTLTVTFTPEDADNKNLEFTYEKEGIVKVEKNSDGTYTVKALKAGTTTVTVTALGGDDVKKTFTVTVTEDQVPGDEHTITLDANGGSCPVTSVKTVNGKVPSLPTPNRGGYHFDGWYAGNKLVKAGDNAEGITKLVAQWTKESGGDKPVNPDKPGGSSSGSHGSGNVGKPGVVGGNQNGGNQGGDQPTTGAFSDVQTGAYYADAVQWAVNQGITTGTTGTTFSPNNPCTRAQIVTFLWRANGSPAATGENPFTDVAQGAYYYDAVLWAVEKGITTGTTATTFSPNNTCTRAQAVTFLHRSAGTPAGGGTNPFTDVGTDAYYTNAVLWAVEKGVTGGTTATTFSPNSTCTRAQIVTFLYRAQ